MAEPDAGAGLGGLARTGPAGGGTTDIDIAAEMRQAMQSLSTPARTGRQETASTSDLSIDEALLLHSVGWEALELVCGVSMVSIPVGVWNWGSGEITWASQGETTAMANAAARLQEECAKAACAGVVGVRVEVSLHRHHVEIALVGTAVRPINARRPSGQPFVSDLSGKDFVLLDQAGWVPLGIAFGTSFVYAPRRRAGAVLRQANQNVELTNYTEALYQARESAMERMQTSAIGLGATGVVAVNVREGPVGFAGHAIGFTAWGTAVKLGPGGHRHIKPQVVLSMDDRVVMFQAESLKG
jgi:uncharacterized protein YbjQ (UPF0145 family)